MRLEKVVPWGRSKREYFGMFNLDDNCLEKNILGCGDGPASFNAEMTACGGQVISCDPLYKFTGTEIFQRFEDSVDEVLNQVKATPDRWVWKYHANPDDLKNNRKEAIEKFVLDYEQGTLQKRYVKAELPALPFKENQFDIALCSHFLFLYSEHFSEEFHIKSVIEMCRIARDIRIFPILALDQTTSPYLEAVCKAVAENGHHSEIITVDYELQKGGNKMLKITKFKGSFNRANASK